MNHKQLARKKQISLRTAYRHYPIHKPQITQAQVYVLLLVGYSIRDIAEILTCSKSKIHRLVS